MISWGDIGENENRPVLLQSPVVNDDEKESEASFFKHEKIAEKR